MSDRQGGRASTRGEASCTPQAAWLVADTQVVLDWLVFGDAAARPLLQAVLSGRLRWLATPAMRTELERMLRHPSLLKWGHDAEHALTFFDAATTLQPDPPTAGTASLVCSDPDDQVFVETALAHGARWLATRDRALLKLRRKAFARGLHILRPDEWRDEWRDSHTAAGP